MTIMNGHPAQPTTTEPGAAAPRAAEPPRTTLSTPPIAHTFMGSPALPRQVTADRSGMLLENPNKFIESIVQDVDQLIESREKTREARGKFWDEFYQEHADLKDVDWHVKSVVGEKLSEWKDLPVAEAKQMIASESRKRIDLLKQKFGVKVDTLSNTGATALPSSGEPAPAPVAPAPRPSSFVEEILQARKKRA